MREFLPLVQDWLVINIMGDRWHNKNHIAEGGHRVDVGIRHLGRPLDLRWCSPFCCATPCWREPTNSKQLSTVAAFCWFSFWSPDHVAVVLSFLRSPISLAEIWVYWRLRREKVFNISGQQRQQPYLPRPRRFQVNPTLLISWFLRIKHHIQFPLS